MPVTGGTMTRGPRVLLRQIREAMADGGPAQGRLDVVVTTIATTNSRMFFFFINYIFVLKPTKRRQFQ